MCADQTATLGKAHGMRADLSKIRQSGPRHPQQHVVHPLKVFTDDEQSGFGQQVVNIRHPSGHRILDRDHCSVGGAVLDGRQHVLEALAGQRVELRQGAR